MREELIKFYLELTNNILPSNINTPIKDNHCFQRVILDFLFKDCWYNHLDKSKTAYKQLTDNQLILATNRMVVWLNNIKILETDNNNSLKYRNGTK